jgi:hypothetical protein
MDYLPDYSSGNDVHGEWCFPGYPISEPDKLRSYGVVSDICFCGWTNWLSNRYICFCNNGLRATIFASAFGWICVQTLTGKRTGRCFTGVGGFPGAHLWEFLLRVSHGDGRCVSLFATCF